MQPKLNGHAKQTKWNAMGFERRQNGNLVITSTIGIELLQGSGCFMMELAEVAIACCCLTIMENHTYDQFMMYLPLRILSIMPALFLVLPHIYFTQNYASIICIPLPISGIHV